MAKSIKFRLKAKELKMKNYATLSDEHLEKAILFQELVNSFKENENQVALDKIGETVETVFAEAMTIPSKEILSDVLNICLEFTEEAKAEIPVEDKKEIEEKVKDPSEEKAKPDPKAKKEPSDKPVGVIGSIVEFLKQKPLTLEELLKSLSERFPERNAASMAQTVKVQIGGKTPTRIEKEKKVSLEIKGEGSLKTYHVI